MNGSIIFFTECEVDYLLASIEMLLRDDRKAMDCRPEVHDAYNARIDADNLKRAWGAATVNTWYKNSTAACPRTGPTACSTTGSRRER